MENLNWLTLVDINDIVTCNKKKNAEKTLKKKSKNKTPCL